MAGRPQLIAVAKARARANREEVLRALRDGRMDRSLAGAELATVLGISAAQYSRLERGLTAGLSIEQATVALAAVGLDLSVRAYPAGEPIRDRAHTSLIDRLRGRVGLSLRFETEVVFPDRRDRRAWDVRISGVDWRMGIEAETRPRDLQALERRLALKARDGEVDHVSLLLLDSRSNRELVRAHADALLGRFPIPARRALECLRDGVDPGGGTLILL